MRHKNKINWKYLVMFAILPCFACTHAADDAITGAKDRPSHRENIMLADPTITVDKGVYYMSGTSQSGQNGLNVLQSTDLKEWTTGNLHQYRFILSPDYGHTYGTKDFFAPQWVKDNNTWYLFYAANNQHCAVAQADSVNGLFNQKVLTAIDPYSHNIDPFYFRDDDGTGYLFYVQSIDQPNIYNNEWGNFIFVAKYDLEKGILDRSTLTRCFSQPRRDSWEWRNPNQWTWPVIEGPTVVKWDGVYYMFYSANAYNNPDYSVGYATATSPMGPWKKYEGNPILSSDIVGVAGEHGTGHGDVFQATDGQYYYVYHVWTDNPDARQVRIAPLIREKDPQTGIYKISIDVKNIITPQKLY